MKWESVRVKKIHINGMQIAGDVRIQRRKV